MRKVFELFTLFICIMVFMLFLQAAYRFLHYYVIGKAWQEYHVCRPIEGYLGNIHYIYYKDATLTQREIDSLINCGVLKLKGTWQ